MNAVTDALSWKLVAGLSIERCMSTNQSKIASTLLGEAILDVDGKADSSAYGLAVSTEPGIEGRLSAAA